MTQIRLTTPTPFGIATLVVRVLVGGYVMFAAVPKIADPLAFATSIGHYELLPSAAVNAFALVIPWLEVLVGTALVLGLRLRTSAILTGVLILVFTTAVAWAVLHNLQIDCGCFGSQGGEDVSWSKVLKNLAMVAGCGLIVWKPESWLRLDH